MHYLYINTMHTSSDRACNGRLLVKFNRNNHSSCCATLSAVLVSFLSSSPDLYHTSTLFKLTNILFKFEFLKFFGVQLDEDVLLFNSELAICSG